uniref:coiled-coil domain-containing protein 13-like n=1 Tax=Myxine glutinosa TaxID=7769 RepID=UPI00358F564D
MPRSPVGEVMTTQTDLHVRGNDGRVGRSKQMDSVGPGSDPRSTPVHAPVPIHAPVPRRNPAGSAARISLERERTLFVGVHIAGRKSPGKFHARLQQEVRSECNPTSSPPIDTAREKVKCLNSVFASKSCVPNPSLSVPTLPSRTQLLLDSVSFSPDKVDKFLSNLDYDPATGQDGISPRLNGILFPLPSGSVLLPHTLLGFTLLQPKLSESLESPSMKILRGPFTHSPQAAVILKRPCGYSAALTARPPDSSSSKRSAMDHTQSGTLQRQLTALQAQQERRLRRKECRRKGLNVQGEMKETREEDGGDSLSRQIESEVVAKQEEGCKDLNHLQSKKASEQQKFENEVLESQKQQNNVLLNPQRLDGRVEAESQNIEVNDLLKSQSIKGTMGPCREMAVMEITEKCRRCHELMAELEVERSKIKQLQSKMEQLEVCRRDLRLRKVENRAAGQSFRKNCPRVGKKLNDPGCLLRSMHSDALERQQVHICNIEQERRQTTDRLKDEVNKLTRVNDESKHKIEAYKARVGLLSTQVKTLKGQMATFLTKSHHDDELVTALMKQQRILQKSLTTYTTINVSGSQEKQVAKKQIQAYGQQSKQQEVVTEINGVPTVRVRKALPIMKPEAYGPNMGTQWLSSERQTKERVNNTDLLQAEVDATNLKIPLSVNAGSSGKIRQAGSDAGRMLLQSSTEGGPQWCYDLQVERERLVELVRLMESRTHKAEERTKTAEQLASEERRRAVWLEKDLERLRCSDTGFPGSDGLDVRSIFQGNLPETEGGRLSQKAHSQQLPTTLDLQREWCKVQCDQSEVLHTVMQRSLKNDPDDRFSSPRKNSTQCPSGGHLDKR